MNVDDTSPGGVARAPDTKSTHECEFSSQELKSIGPWPSLVLVHAARQRGYDPYNTADVLLAQRMADSG